MPKSTKLTAELIEAALEGLPGWNVTEQIPAGSDHSHIELHRLFEFASFAEAMHFMLTASRFIHINDHHPRWQNLYAIVEVWITTGDLKHELSAQDFALAAYLETLFNQYQS